MMTEVRPGRLMMIAWQMALLDPLQAMLAAALFYW